MMSSLVPGSLFYTPGLNRKSAPTSITENSDHTATLYNRPELDDNPWPYESPIHNMYDVRNTSTKMIILNNKYGKDRTRLRGYYTGPNIRKSERQTDPERHSRVNSPRNPHHHERCLQSGTPYFEPSIKPDIEWTNQTERPANSLTVRSAVNQKRHLHCVTPSATSTYSPDSPRDHSPRPMSRISRSSMPPQRYYKEYADLTIGEKIYLWSIEKIYNIENLKRLKQDQYQKLLELEAKKGQNVSWKDYDKYMRYIQSASTRHYGTRSPSPSNRARSALSTRSESARYGSAKRNRTPREDHDTISRPRTTSSRVRRSRTADPGSEKSKKQDDENYEVHTDSEATTSKSEPTKTSTLRSENTTDKDTSKTDDEKLTKQPTKRPTSKTSQGQGHRPKSSASRSTKSLSPYATPLYTLSPYASRTSSAKSSRSSRPSSYKSTKSKTGSSKSSGKEKSKEANSDRNEVAHHKEGVDRPKSRLGHPSPVDKGAFYFSDQKSDTSSYSEYDFFTANKPLANINDKNTEDKNITNKNITDKNIADKNIKNKNITDKNIGDNDLSDASSVTSSDSERNIISPRESTEQKEYTKEKEDKSSDSSRRSSDSDREVTSRKATEEKQDKSNIKSRDKEYESASQKETGVLNDSLEQEDKNIKEEQSQIGADIKTEMPKDNTENEDSKHAEETDDESKDRISETNNNKTRFVEEPKEPIENSGRDEKSSFTNKDAQEPLKDEVKTSTGEVEYTDLKSKWKKENEEAAQKSMIEKQWLSGLNDENKNDVRHESSDGEDFDRRPNRDLDKIEY